MPNTPPNLVAGGNIRPCRFVKLSGSYNHTALECDANEAPIGIAQEGSNYPPLSDLSLTVYAATSGQGLRIFGEGDVCLLEAGAEITRGARLKSDADGRGVPIASTGTAIQNIGAVALQSAAAAGEKIQVQVTFYSERPALT